MMLDMEDMKADSDSKDDFGHLANVDLPELIGVFKEREELDHDEFFLKTLLNRNAEYFLRWDSLLCLHTFAIFSFIAHEGERAGHLYHLYHVVGYIQQVRKRLPLL